MARTMRGSLALIALATVVKAQEVNLRGFKSSGTSFVSFSSSSVMGENGHMHTQTHKVNTQTSDDGLEKRVSEVMCKDGACYKSLSITGRLSSFVPPSIRDSLPSMSELPGMSHVQAMFDRMQQVQYRLQKTRPIESTEAVDRPMHIHFLAPQPLQRVMLLPGQKVFLTPPLWTNVMPESSVSDSASGNSPLQVSVVIASAVVLVLVTFTIVMALRSCLCGKAQARESSLQALGEPLAPESSAELGLAGVAPRPQAAAKAPASSTTQAYLFGLYSRAGAPRSEAELAAIVVREIYAKAAGQ